MVALIAVGALVSSLDSARAASPALDIHLEKFGPLLSHLEKDRLWRGFDDSKSPVLVFTRAERRQATAAACAASQKALFDFKVGDVWDGSPKIASWEPWSKDDLKAITECDKSPCDVKVDAAEGKSLGDVAKEERFKRYLGIVGARVGQYHAGKKRNAYEFPGDPIDPWAWFDELGFHSASAMPAKQNLVTRSLDLGHGKFRTIRQVLDVRAGAVTAKEATVWIRDVVTDHYFDSWGEWRDIRCDGEGEALITIGMVFEFDLLKDNDLVAKLSRGSLKRGINELTQVYMDGIVKAIQP